MYKTAIILLFLLPSLPAFTQQNCQCQVYTQLNKTKQNDSLMAIKLIKSSHTICQAKGYELMGQWFNNKNKPNLALLNLQKALHLYQKNNCNDSLLLNIYKQFAQYYYGIGDFAAAQKFSFKLLQSATLVANVYEIAKCNTMIAQLFNQTGQATQGIIYTRKAANAIPEIKNLNEKRGMLFSVSKRYLWHYQDTKIKTSLDSSELLGQQCLNISKIINNRIFISQAYSHLQGIAYEYGNYPKAMRLLDSSFAYIDNTQLDDLAVNFFDKADIYIELKQFVKAESAADSSLHYNQMIGNISYIAEAYALIARIAKEKGDYKKALKYILLEKEITDSIKNTNTSKAVTELEKKYNQVKNENTITELSKKKQLYFFIALAGLLSAMALAFFFRQNTLKNKKNILETEQRLNRARMNPHFFFNTLTTLQKLALTQNNGQAMASNLAKFSNIMRETLESTYKDYISIEQEMEFLNQYLEVQKIRFPQTFSYQVSAQASVAVDELQIPSMIIQPFIENSIEHGFAGVTYPGVIDVQFEKDNQNLIITITDNGNGLNTQPKQNNHISRASQIINDRLYLLNRKLKTKAHFSINNRVNGNGVVVKIHLPILFI